MSELTAAAALKLVGEIFVYHMPFNRALGLELERYEKEFAQLSFNNQPMMVGNWAQSILHGGVIASALDVAAGLVCVGSTEAHFSWLVPLLEEYYDPMYRYQLEKKAGQIVFRGTFEEVEAWLRG